MDHEITLRQMGTTAGRLCAMLGAKAVLTEENALSFRFAAKARNGANHARIELTPADEYKITFTRIGRFHDFRTVETIDGVGADALRSTFERATGLRVSL